VIKTSKEVLKKRADARFRQEARALDGRKAMTEYEAQVLAIREKTARLKALRLAKEAQVQSEESFRQRLGQCGDGELLLVAKDRTHSAQNVPIAG